MMSVLQEVKGLTTTFIILPVGRPVSMQNFRLNVYMVYLFWHRYSQCIVRTDNHLVNGKIICLCTSSDENLFTCKISGPKLLQLLSYASSWRRWRRWRRRWRICENHIYLYFTPHVFFCMQLFFYLLSTLMSFKVRLRLKLKVKTLMCGYNAGPPMAIPIYTVLPYCVYIANVHEHEFGVVRTCSNHYTTQETWACGVVSIEVGVVQPYQNLFEPLYYWRNKADRVTQHDFGVVQGVPKPVRTTVQHREPGMWGSFTYVRGDSTLPNLFEPL